MRKLPLSIISTLILFCVFTSIKTFAQDSLKVKEGIIKVATNQSIKQLIAKKRAYNKNKTYVDGYKIQIYYGSEQAAIKKMEEFKIAFPEVPTERRFTSPDWKIWVGNYKKRLEADRALQDIKKEFPSAIPVSAKIKI